MSNEHTTQDAEKVYSGGTPTQLKMSNEHTTQDAEKVYSGGTPTQLAYGGLAQFIAGVWEFASGNTFGATAFCSYGAFWWSYAALFIPFFGIQEAFMAENVFESQFTSAVGIYLHRALVTATSWGIFTFIMLLASFRASIGLASLFLFLDITFWLLVGAEFSGNSMVETAAGAFGIITAAIAFYVGAAGLLTPETSLFTLPVGDLSRKD
ncbi:probable fun34-transmembrane protein involved in ammonia production [Ceraceosorus bombacis]|uniref:Probable fun34-transmembrane protein involved in ammonia production n=1 Tax=Ceraceosorus bombacis TaxID=401625 RepID=A0A0P1BDA5_9BASI|nr:probable fun34-transmembrane protein involved in ammonia production [Ceraceosorus bombacis]